MAEALTEEEAKQSARRSRPRDPSPRQTDLFIKGPFPLHQYRLACRLPGAALIVWQLVHHQKTMQRREGVTLPDRLAAQFGMSRWVKLRAVQILSQVGLLVVLDHGKGRAFTLGTADLSKEDCEQAIARLEAQPRIVFTDRVVSFKAAQARKPRAWNQAKS
jgi:hypothetical protein